MLQDEDVRKFTDAINEKTLILTDFSYLYREYLSAYTFYSDLFSGREEGFPKKEFPKAINLERLHRAIAQLGHVRWPNSLHHLFLSREQYTALDQPIVNNVQYHIVNKIPILPMRDAIVATPKYRRIVLICDNHGYLPLVEALVKREYLVFVFKHRQEGSGDVSYMPTEMPYQFVDYLAGMSMGLDLSEL